MPCTVSKAMDKYIIVIDGNEVYFYFQNVPSNLYSDNRVLLGLLEFIEYPYRDIPLGISMSLK